MRFSREPLTPAELAAVFTHACARHDVDVTEYQYRALAVLGDDFHRYTCKKYPPEEVCVWTVEEFKPLFNEIHRAVVYFVSQGMSVKEALIEFITPSKGRKVEVDGPATGESAY